MPWPMTSKEEISAVWSVIGPTYRVTGSMDLTHSSLKSMKKNLKKKPKQKDFGSGFFHFPINSLGSQPDRPHLPPPLHRSAQLGGTKVQTLPGRFARGTL